RVGEGDEVDRDRPVEALPAQGPEGREAQLEVPDQDPAAEELVEDGTALVGARPALVGAEGVEVVAADELGVAEEEGEEALVLAQELAGVEVEELGPDLVLERGLAGGRAQLEALGAAERVRRKEARAAVDLAVQLGLLDDDRHAVDDLGAGGVAAGQVRDLL